MAYLRMPRRWAGWPEASDDGGSSALPRRLARPLAFAGIAVGTYLLALVWTVPAALLVPPQPGILGAAGTIWRGEATLSDGSVARWRWAPLRSLVSLGFALDWEATGAGTAIAGRALVGPGSVTVDEVAGRASATLIGAIFPSLPFTCAMPLQLTVERARIGGGSHPFLGEIRSEAGTCVAHGGGAPVAVPPLIATGTREGDGSELLIAPLGQRRRILVDGALDADGRMMLRVTPEGAALLPFASTPGGLRLEMTL